jgi:phosphate transport system protein
MPDVTHFWERKLADIREQLLTMSSLAEYNLSRAMRALIERDDGLANTVEAADSAIDDYEMRIDDMVVTYMATHGAVATDCRFLLAASKISNNLERIADQATTICRRARDLNREPLLKPLIDIPLIAETAQDMLRQGIAAFIDSNPEAARAIIARDKKVDGMYKQLARELTIYMIEDPTAITRALHLMTVAKALERVADHATNIAEEVFFLYRAEDIRHDPTIKHSAG